jgi:hypothetical protein
MEDFDSASAKEPTGRAYSAPPPLPPQSFKRRHWGKLLLLVLVVVPVLGISIWTYAALNWTYSSADRAGYVQKISEKGWLCKTWEGTLYTDIAKGFRSDSFQFSIRSDSIAHLLQNFSGKKVSVHYEQHKGVPTSCFGETEYFVSGVRELQN